MHLAIILNPTAAHERAGRLLPAIEQFFRERQVKTDILLTTHRGHGVNLVKQLPFENYDGVLAAGGDGTLFEVVNGYFQNPALHRIPLGILPIGTGNAFIRDMEPAVTDWQAAAAVICQNRTRMVDVGRFTTEGQTYHYLNILGLGFVADVGLTAHKLKLVGNLSYTLGVIWRTLFLNTFQATIALDGKNFEKEVIFIEISNSRWTSNFLMAPKARIDDGLLDVTLVRQLSRARLLQCFPKIFAGDHIFMPEVEQYQVRRIAIQTKEPKILTPDGELLGSTPIVVECLPQALEVYWP